MSGDPDLLLVFPPFWDAGMPYLAVPTLAAYLRARGLRVESVDLNLGCVRRLLTAEQIEAALRTAEEMCRREHVAQEFIENVTLCAAVWALCGRQLTGPFQVGVPAPATLDEWTSFRRKLNWAFLISSAPYFPMRMGARGLVTADYLDRLSGVCSFVESGRMPAHEHMNVFAREQARRNIGVLGISVAGPSQLLPALYLAERYKKHSGGAFVCIGGAQIPYVLDALAAFPKPFAWVDAFVSGEGELPLQALCEAARSGRDVAGIPGVRVWRSGALVGREPAGEIALEDLPPPDFTGFEPPRYIANTGALPMTFARGCSWSRCAFCTQHICFGSYRAMSCEQMAGQVADLTRRFAVRTVSVNDENVTPRRLLEFGHVIHSTAPQVRWQALARIVLQLAEPTVAHALADSGCRMLCLGLESASQQVLDFNNKGIRAANVVPVLRTLRNAGIWTHIFLIIGLPGETRESALEGIEFCIRNRNSFDSVSPTLFRLERGSAIARDPVRYGITLGTQAADHCDAEISVESSLWLKKDEGTVFLESLVTALVGSPQCPLEQGDLDGQVMLDLLYRLGASGLRSEMNRRASQTAHARDVLRHDSVMFGPWWDAHVQTLPAGASVLCLLAEPRRTIFTRVSAENALIFRLRSLGIGLDLVKNGFSTMAKNEHDHVVITWAFDSAILGLLSSRVLQESLTGKAEDGSKHPENLSFLRADAG